MSKKKLILLQLFVTIIVHPLSTLANVSNICDTEVCREKSQEMKGLMDESVDPCDNFYSYACGQWNKDTVVPPGRPWTARFLETMRETGNKVSSMLEDPTSLKSKSVAVQKIIQMYESCKNVYSHKNEHEETFRKLFNDRDDNEYGGCPMVIGNEYDSSRVTLEKMVVLMSNLKKNFLMNIQVYTDSRNSNKNIIYLDQGELGLSANTYGDSTRFANQLNGYKGYMKNSTKYIIDLLDKTRTEDQIDTSVNGIFDLEEELSKIMLPFSHYSNIARTYNPMSINDLNNNYPNINWTILFDELYEDREHILSDSDMIIVKVPSYFEKLNELIPKTSKTDFINAAYWFGLIKPYALETTEEMRDIYLNYKRYIGQSTTLVPRGQHCISVVNNEYHGLGLIGSHLFLKKYFSEESKVKAVEIVEKVRKVWEKRMFNYEWMDAEIKGKSKCKIDLMESLVGYPDWIHSHVDVDYYFSKLATPDTVNNWVNMMNMNKFLASVEFKKLSARPNKLEWIVAPTAVNAFYKREDNTFIISAGLMQKPFFQSNYPMYIKLGTMGMIVGHEIGHGFDSRGRQYDHTGSINPWWKQETIDKFTNLTRCFADHFSTYEIPEIKNEPGWQNRAFLNGSRMLPEVLADNSGVVSAYDTLKEHIKINGEEKRLPGFENFNNEQMFYLSYAQTFCGKSTKVHLRQTLLNGVYPPFKYRVLGAISNSKGFAQAYNCPVSKKMNRGDQRCTLY